MTNIRDQCSWVHKDDPEAATEKAVDLMRMAVARARHLKALQTGQVAGDRVGARPRRRSGRHDRGAGHRRPGLCRAPGGEGSRRSAACCATSTARSKARTCGAYLGELVARGAGSSQDHRVPQHHAGEHQPATWATSRRRRATQLARSRRHQPRRDHHRDRRPGTARPSCTCTARTRT